MSPFAQLAGPEQDQTGLDRDWPLHAAPRTGASLKPPKALPILDQGSAPRERADAARNRKRILDAARALVRCRPIADIAMDDVAREAGVGKGTLYRRFADRTALCHALLDDNERALQERILRGFDLPSTTPPQERLLILLEALFTFVLENASILAEAEASHRGPRPTAVMAWRRIELVRWLRACGASSPAVTAELLLATMSAEVVLFTLGSGVEATTLRETTLQFWQRALGLTAR